MSPRNHGSGHLITRRAFLRTLGLTTGAALVTRQFLYAEHPAFEPFTFVQMSDAHVGKPKAAGTFRRAIESVEALRPRPEFLLITGDLAEKRRRNRRQFRDILAGTRVPVHLVPGNHDVGNRISERSLALVGRYRETYGDDRYAFTVGEPGTHALFLVLNSLWMRPWGTTSRKRRRKLTEHIDTQWQWFETQLDASRNGEHPATSVFVCLHHPPFTNRPQQRLASYLTITMKAKRRLLALCVKHKVQAVLTGHVHRSHLHTYRGVQLINSPSVFWNTPRLGGGKVPLGYRVFHVRGDGIDYRYKTLDIRDLAPYRVKTMKQAPGDGDFYAALDGHAGNPRALITV